MAKTMPSPRIPFVYDFATSERKKLNAYRALARQIEDKMDQLRKSGL